MRMPEPPPPIYPKLRKAIAALNAAKYQTSPMFRGWEKEHPTLRRVELVAALKEIAGRLAQPHGVRTATRDRYIAALVAIRDALNQYEVDRKKQRS